MVTLEVQIRGRDDARQILQRRWRQRRSARQCRLQVPAGEKPGTPMKMSTWRLLKG